LEDEEVMSFTIEFLDTLLPDYTRSGEYADGRIVVDDYEETFSAALDVMSKRDYMAQWVAGIKRILRGHETSAIVTSYADRGGEILGMWYSLYRQADTAVVLIHNHLMLRDVVGGNFAVARYFEFVPPYESVNEDGERISEWLTSVSDLTECHTRLQRVIMELG
jgi:hypothetical protein